MAARKYPVLIALRVTPAVASYIDRLVSEGKHKGRAHLLRSMINELKRDDEMAHGMSLE